MSYTVRPAKADDFDQWSGLYDGYADFYQVPMDTRIKQTLWSWIHDEQHVMNALVATADDGKLVGFAHVRAMPSPLRGAYVGFLDDLFVDPELRGSGVASLLFEALERHGRAQGWPIIRWITADNNYRARNLYDKVSQKTAWNTYQMDLD